MDTNHRVFVIDSSRLMAIGRQRRPHDGLANVRSLTAVPAAFPVPAVLP